MCAAVFIIWGSNDWQMTRTKTWSITDVVFPSPCMYVDDLVLLVTCHGRVHTIWRKTVCLVPPRLLCCWKLWRFYQYHNTWHHTGFLACSSLLYFSFPLFCFLFIFSLVGGVSSSGVGDQICTYSVLFSASSGFLAFFYNFFQQARNRPQQDGWCNASLSLAFSHQPWLLIWHLKGWSNKQLKASWLLPLHHYI